MNKLESFSNGSLSPDNAVNFLYQQPNESSVNNASSHAAQPKEAAAEESRQPLLAQDFFVGESLSQRLRQAKKSATPLYDAARPLLRTLSEIPNVVDNLSSVEVLKTWLKREMTLFTQLCEQLDVPWRKMAIVRYCLCTALDEAIHTTQWGVESGWSQHNLLNYFEEDNDGGNKFFLLTGRLAMSPSEYHDVLIILLHILNLGFEGRYSIQQDGQQQLAQIRQQLYQLVLSHSTPVATPLAPQGLVDYPSRPALKKRISSRVTISLFLLFTAGSFLFYRFQLMQKTADIEAQLLLLTQQLTVSPLPQTKLSLPILLQQEIEHHLLELEPITQGYKIRLISDSMFMSGSAELMAPQREIIQRIASAVKQIEASVLVIGHSDSQPVHRNKTTTNQQLSLQRAAQVAHYFQEAGVDERKIHIMGAGDSQPRGPNLTQKQREINRRVEFVVTL